MWHWGTTQAGITASNWLGTHDLGEVVLGMGCFDEIIESDDYFLLLFYPHLLSRGFLSYLQSWSRVPGAPSLQTPSYVLGIYLDVLRACVPLYPDRIWKSQSCQIRR